MRGSRIKLTAIRDRARDAQGMTRSLQMGDNPDVLNPHGEALAVLRKRGDYSWPVGHHRLETIMRQWQIKLAEWALRLREHGEPTPRSSGCR